MTKKVERPTVLVGDVFRDQDPRTSRQIRVLEVSKYTATVQKFSGVGPRTSIKLERLRPFGAKKGYRLIERGGKPVNADGSPVVAPAPQVPAQAPAQVPAQASEEAAFDDVQAEAARKREMESSVGAASEQAEG